MDREIVFNGVSAVPGPGYLLDDEYASLLWRFASMITMTDMTKKAKSCVATNRVNDLLLVLFAMAMLSGNDTITVQAQFTLIAKHML